jgi:GT2 family glycosyltransferase
VLTIAIPTLNRGAVLCDTVTMLLDLGPPADEILIVDQTPEHPAGVAERLRLWTDAGAVRIIRLPEPSITKAMNTALREATQPYVLFLDDDIVPSQHLVRSHLRAFTAGTAAVVGQILQPGDTPEHYDEARLSRGAVRDLEFRFNHDTPREVCNVMAGNLCVDRAAALRVGGFDENFVGAAYRFETDFALRLIAHGGVILFQPEASIRHLKAPAGGTRSHGDHRTSSSPAHSVGDYYFALRHVPHFWRYTGRRLGKNLLTRYHASHPWSIPGKLIGEIRGLILARRLAKRRVSGKGE